MGLDFYYVPGSAPCRAVLLTFKALNLSPNLILLNLGEGEHLKPEFVKINPQHTVPTLVDDGFVLWESRAIMTYLVNKYGKGNSSLYPEEAKARAQVDQRLYFDIGTLYARFAAYYYPPLFTGAKPDESKLPPIDEAFKFLNTFLESSGFAAGESLTVADLTLVATVSTFDAMDYNVNQYPNVAKWYQKVKSVAPGYQEANEQGIVAFKALVAHLRGGH